jgi:hypothetical protein
MMRSMIPAVAIACIALAVPSEAARISRGPTSKHKQKTTAKAAPHQRAIDDERATQIQGALVKAGYLNEASGHWDAASEAAMQKLQSDNGWQTKIIPDSRALIKLGLGPNQATEAAPAVPNSAQEADAPGGK